MYMVDFKIKNTNLIFNKALSQIWGMEKYSYKSVARQDYGLLYLSKGLITYSYDDCIIELKPGDIIYLPKGSNYEVDFNARNSKVENILINFDVVGDAEFTEIKKPICILNDKTRKMYHHFNNILNSYYQKDRPFLINSYFYLCLDALQEETHLINENKNSLLLRQAAKLLEESTEITVDTICGDILMSRSVFQKKFKEYFGLSPIEYRTAKRIEKAKMLLEATDITIKEIVAMLGYYDTAYFYKVFEKATSLTPKKYRDKNKTHF